MSHVRKVWITPDAEKHIAYCARVSSDNPDNPEIDKLLKYCIKHGHWSIFEMANMCIEIVTSRAISAQILRHRSFSFQEFSQRYARATEFETAHPRRQDNKNRQNSIDDICEEDKVWWSITMRDLRHHSNVRYKEALKRGIAKECARMLLPMCTQTKLYMSGTIRSWMHYLQVRSDPSTQLEHREVADSIKETFVKELPIISAALGWV